MNFLCISPHFPANITSFCKSLQEAGGRVLGLADEPYDQLAPELKQSLTEYYRVNNLNDYDEVLRACGYFTHRYGKIDRIESHNEHWLQLDAALRTDFNVVGVKNSQIPAMKLKSQMKSAFARAGVEVVEGAIVNTLTEGKDFVKKHGYPVVVKPDNGVGAAGTWKIDNDRQLNNFFTHKPETDYFIEPFVTGAIETFDGLVDADGNAVFTSSLVYGCGVMESVNDNLDLYYYIPRVLPDDLVTVGLATLNVFGLRERFFHIEFFRTAENRLIGLEINIRPPGGLTLDMFNYANNLDIYGEYANIVLGKPFSAEISRRYVCFYAGRKSGKNYRYSVADLLREHGDAIIHHQPVASVFSAAIGNYGFIVRTDTFEQGKKIVDAIHQQQI